MDIAGREIGDGPPYIVAEISGNHCGHLDKAFALIKAAEEAGADAVKFQAYTADTITIDCDKPDFIMQAGPWKGRKLYELYAKACTPLEWFPALFGAAAENGITAFASVFDRSSVDALEKLDCPAYKIASMEIVDIPLIKYARATGKPLIISTGMASDPDIADAMAGYHSGRTALLHCVSGYPVPTEEANLHRLQEFLIFYECVGISDHTLGWDVPVAATVLGAQIIEKHLILAEDDCAGVSEDEDFSVNPAMFREMCHRVRAIWKAMRISKAESEEPQRQARRSLYVVKDVKKGEMFTDKNVRSIRPGYGLAPKHLPDVLGQRATRDIEYGSKLQADMIDD